LLCSINLLFCYLLAETVKILLSDLKLRLVKPGLSIKKLHAGHHLKHGVSVEELAIANKANLATESLSRWIVNRIWSLMRQVSGTSKITTELTGFQLLRLSTAAAA